MMILFVTSKCNSKCRTCFYWDKLNADGDLTFEELETLSQTTPNFNFLFLSGGEPFMREELTSIVRLFSKNNGVKYVNIPTSGLFKKRVLDWSELMVKENAHIRFDLAVSIDGFSETNDHIRGVPGDYNVALETLRGLTEIAEEYRNLYVYVNSTVTSENILELPDFGRQVLENFKTDGHFFNVIRGNPMDESLKSIGKEDLSKFYNAVSKINFEYISREYRREKHLLSSVREASWKGGYLYAYRSQLASQFSEKDWGMPCTAGQTSVVVDYNGDMRICELRRPIGNLRDYDMNFSRLWSSEFKRDELVRMEMDHCTEWCTHICFFFNSMLHSKKAMLLEIPFNYLKYQVTGKV